MGKKLLPEKEYLESLPKKRMGVGVLLFFLNQILIVKPTYRNHWLLPGGVIDLNESPLMAAKREVLEELGLKIEINYLLAVDYLHRNDEITECLQFLFSGGEISSEQIESIRLQNEEISEMRFVEISEAKNFLSASATQRLASFVANPKTSLYLENGKT